MAYLYLKLSTSKELNTSSESLSSNLSTSDNSFTWSSEEKEEDEVYFQNNLDVSDECECDQCYSGAYRKSACGPRTVCWFISSLNNEITDLRNSKQHLQENLIKKDREIKDNNSVIEKLEEQFKMVSEKLEQIRNTTDKRIQELEEQLNEKDQNTTEKTKAIHSLENQCKITQELEEKLNEKDRDIIEKNEVIVALENQCKL
ncbi:myosin heavy chain, clone 203-like [Ruditapes philippinarum]|uniref:myosin heavy chain, clone 203-like n=1 Tax=Ruditapes philippinarum TaxID=129788 RepID=UPI00295AB4B7|nr:myosin heavy chain, clone 203-like [Ruditapes philippinarum]